MAIVPTVRCSRMASSIAFYTKVLDFECAGNEFYESDPSYNVLTRVDDPDGNTLRFVQE